MSERDFEPDPAGLPGSSPERPIDPTLLKGRLSALQESIENARSDPDYIDPENATAYFTEEQVTELWKAGVVNSVSEVETCLRDMGSDIYCIALPLYAEGAGYPTWYPGDRDDEPKYTLGVAFGKQEASGMLQEWGITAEENAARLDQTGILLTSL